MRKKQTELSAGKKIFIGLSALLAVGAIGCQAEASNKANTGEGASKPAQVQAEPKVQEESSKIAITAPQLIAKYAANEVNADNNFKGKTLHVTGTVSDIKKDIADDIYVTLKGDEESFSEVQCFFADAETAGKLQKGMKVTFKGQCDGLMMNVLMKDCELVSGQ